MVYPNIVVVAIQRFDTFGVMLFRVAVAYSQVCGPKVVEH